MFIYKFSKNLDENGGIAILENMIGVNVPAATEGELTVIGTQLLTKGGTIDKFNVIELGENCIEFARIRKTRKVVDKAYLEECFMTLVSRGTEEEQTDKKFIRKCKKTAKSMALDAAKLVFKTYNVGIMTNFEDHNEHKLVIDVSSPVAADEIFTTISQFIGIDAASASLHLHPDYSYNLDAKEVRESKNITLCGPVKYANTAEEDKETVSISGLEALVSDEAVAAEADNKKLVSVGFMLEHEGIGYQGKINDVFNLGISKIILPEDAEKTKGNKSYANMIASLKILPQLESVFDRGTYIPVYAGVDEDGEETASEESDN